MVQIGVLRHEAILLVIGGEAHAIDIVVAVALEVREAEQREEGDVLLGADAGPGAQVLGGEEKASAALFCMRRATRAAFRMDL